MNEMLIELGQRANRAKYIIEALDSKIKNDALLKIADALISNTDFILSENKKDIADGIAKSMKEGLLDRLRLTPERIIGISEGIRQVVELPDPIGEILDSYTAVNGLNITKKRVPMGVIGIIYESRPNVTADAFSLCFKAGNAVMLKGGSDAINTNMAITKVIRDTLNSVNITPDAILLIESTDRNVAMEFMKLKEYVDLLIPRGGAGLIQSVVMNSTIPVIETGTGNCHIFIDETADLDKAIDVIINAKTQRIGVCNACESLVIHKNIEEAFLPKLKEALELKNVEIRGDKDVSLIIDCNEATEDDFGTEYLDLIISIKTVSNVDEAIEHINKYTTHHSESILTSDKINADKFLKSIDAACVYVNASTRFTDGFEFGLGAEIGISTQKLHARGPMGLKELTSYKYNILGDYTIRK